MNNLGEWKPTAWAMLVAMIVVAFGSALMGCTVAPGTESSVSTPFGGGSVKTADPISRAEAVNAALQACWGPLSHGGETPSVKALRCDCAREIGQVSTHWYATNCLSLPAGVVPVIQVEEANVAPEAPRGGQLERDLKAAEGLAAEPYLLDGVLHTGYGHNVQANAVLHEDMETAKAAAATVVGEDVYNGLSQRRKDALAELAFNVGEEGLRRFVELVRAVKNGLFHKAAAELMDSDLGRKFPTRATRLANALRNG